MAEPIITIAGMPVHVSRWAHPFAIYLLSPSRFIPLAAGARDAVWPLVPPRYIVGTLALPYLEWFTYWRAAWWLDA